MPLRTIASFAVAILLGLIAVLLVRGILGAQRPAVADASGSTTPVVVAALPIERGVGLKPAMLKVVNYPKASVPAGAFRTVEELAAADGAERTVLRSIEANEPVLAGKLTGAGGRTNLSGALEPGMRAVSVRSSDVAGVGGFVLPGDRVDIMVTRVLGDGANASTVTQILAENALVMGVDQTSDQEADKPQVAKAITVQVTPDQAQVISLAQAVGQISLSLRQISDDAVLSRKLTTVADLGPAVRRIAINNPFRRPAPKAPEGPQVRVTRGVETAEYPLGAR